MIHKLYIKHAKYNAIQNIRRIHMALSFAELKKSRQSTLDTLTKELTKLQAPSGGSDDDSRFWKPTVDKAGNGMATIRFLPSPEGEDMPFVRVFSHGFKGPTGLWYIENSLTTIGKEDPVSQYNSQLWNSTTDDASPARKQVREQKRKLNFISNILVVKDSANPQNEGKVFLFQYGKKIFDKINESMNPQFEDEEPMNPFDMWTGANFKLKIRQVEGYRNYDKSEFEAPAPISNDDDELEALWRKEHKLSEFVDPSKFKSYDELKAKLNRVLGLDGAVTAGRGNTAESNYDDDIDMSTHESIKRTAKAPAMQTASSGFNDDEGDDLDFLKKLAEED